MADKHQSLINGICEARFRKVREEFTENFETRHERGGAVAVWDNGQLVVDLWGGWSDLARTVCWSRDTILNVFSVSKAFCAIAIMRLVDLGLLDLDRRVSDYWPEFAAGGKGDVTVRQLMSHQAGLPAIRKPLPDGAALDWDVITSALAEQEPWWEPGTAHGYHVNTFGFLAGELDRRVSDYWPEFAAGGKGDVTVRQLMSHQAGLPAIRKPLPDGAALDWDVITSALAEQEPWWEPGTAHGYHVNTFGFLAGELVRRTDGRSIGTLLREDVAAPLGADLAIGLPA